MGEPPINEIVGFLDKYAPRALADLQRKYTDPEQSELLKPGIIAGKVNRQLQLRAEATIVGLNASMDVCDQTISTVRQKLKRGSIFQFVSQIMTAISGASILTALQLDAPRAAKYLAAAFALFGSLMALTGRQSGATLDPSGNLFNQYKELVDCKIEGQQIRAELEPWIQGGFRGDSRAELIAQTNALLVRVERTKYAIG